MAIEKQLLGRIIHKHDIEENWDKATGFIPKQGEIIVYDIDENYNYERFKIGDGNTSIINLPFQKTNINDLKAVSYDMAQELTDEQKTQARTNIGAISIDDIPTPDVQPSAIIDVIALPTENIDEDSFYRLLTGTFVYNQYAQNGWTCYCVESLPETGEPVTVDMQSVTAYYNVQDGGMYGYINDMLSAAAGVPVGWYTLDVLAPAFGVQWGGVITNILDDPIDDSIRLLLEYVVYSYKDGWTALKPIGRAGTGISAEVFNHLSNTASGDYSHAEGWSNTASGLSSHTEGESNTASGNASHAEGWSNTASGFSSHAEGESNTASGDYSHAEGYGNTASCGNSHAEGWSNTASGFSSHAEGANNYAAGRSQHVQGEYNAIDPEYDKNDPYKRDKYAHIVGNGTDENNRSNAHTLDWEGNAWFAGDVYVGSTSGTNKDEGSVKLIKNGDTELILTSSTAGSTKKFRITIDDNGVLTTEEVSK